MKMIKQNRLRELRKKAGLSQSDLAESIHFAQSMISGWENNTKRMNLEQAKLLADFFGVSVGYLAGDTMQNEQPTGEADELRALAIERVSSLSDPALERVLDFLAGLEAGQEIGAAQAAAQESGSESS